MVMCSNESHLAQLMSMTRSACLHIAFMLYFLALSPPFVFATGCTGAASAFTSFAVSSAALAVRNHRTIKTTDDFITMDSYVYF